VIAVVVAVDSSSLALCFIRYMPPLLPPIVDGGVAAADAADDDGVGVVLSPIHQ
jgi:hypothetical protein